MNDPRLVAARDLAADRRRGGELRVLLGPRTVGSTSGFLGLAVLRPGERIAEHYHPYSEEFLYVARGEIVVDLDDLPVAVRRAEGLFVPMNTRHRLRNVSKGPAEVVFHLSPLAPRPELGHVDTEGPAVLGPGPDAAGAGRDTARSGPRPVPRTRTTTPNGHRP